MRLINAQTFLQNGSISFAEFYDGKEPKYAILSHTWDEGQEVTYEDCGSGDPTSKTGYSKISNTCRLAVNDRIEYVWIDTCCIDKSSSAELTEAINSMFLWYHRASVCYVYLADMCGSRLLRDCRWFLRGWTLQELIAPKVIYFFNHTWMTLGSKENLIGELAAITQIDGDILSHRTSLASICVAKRLSWAVNRSTTRVEDMAYCLLGIFSINMPLLYGEGQRAFRRLQEEIVRSTYDLSILAWTPSSSKSGEYCGFLAESVKDFSNCSRMYSVTDYLLDEGEMAITNKGFRLKAPEYILQYTEYSLEREITTYQYALKLNCIIPGYREDFFTVPMRKIGPNTFIRARDQTRFFSLEPVNFRENESYDFTILTELPNIGIPPVLPGHTAEDLVASSRHSVVEIKLPGELSQDDTKERPIKYWDVQDCAFFGTQSSRQNWAALSLGDDALFLCFWHKYGSDDQDWVFRSTILGSRHEGFDDLWRHLFLFAGEFNYQAPTVKELLDVRQSVYRTSVRNRSTTTSFTVRREDDPAVCSGPRWEVQIRM